MSDFLTRVSRAALGLTPVVQVLGASRYAPGRDLYRDLYAGEGMIAEEREVDAVVAEAAAPVERASPIPARTTSERNPYRSEPLPHAAQESEPLAGAVHERAPSADAVHESISPVVAPLPAVLQRRQDATPVLPVADLAQNIQAEWHLDMPPAAQGARPTPLPAVLQRKQDATPALPVADPAPNIQAELHVDVPPAAQGTRPTPLPAVLQRKQDATPALPLADPAQTIQAELHVDVPPAAQGTRPTPHGDAGGTRAEGQQRRSVPLHAPDQPPMPPTTGAAKTSLIPVRQERDPESGPHAAAAAPSERAGTMLPAPWTRSEGTALEIPDAPERAPVVRETAITANAAGSTPRMPATPISEVAIADREPRPQTVPLFEVAPRGHSSASRRAATPLSALEERPGSEPSAPPIIRVNIGRIDVRAAPPPPPPVEAPGPPAPRMSLDEYLQSHNGRSR